MEYKDLRKYLGISISEENKLKKAKNYMLNHYLYSDILKNLSAEEIKKIGYKYCNTIGKEFKALFYSDSVSFIINDICSEYCTFQETVLYLKAFESSLNDKYLVEKIENIFEEALNKFEVNYYVINVDNEKIYLLSGAKEFDDKLIADPLNWMDEYSETKELWINSIKAYCEYPKERASEVSDLFRKTLEKFFKEFFETQSSLENCLSYYGKYLEEKSIPKEISNNLKNTLDLYCKFNNEYSKHNYKTSSNILEYIMYQTGLIIRLLIILKNN